MDSLGRVFVYDAVWDTIPGMATSVNAVMSQLEQEPGEFIVDAWVVERATLVAEQGGRAVAASQVLRCANADHVSDCYRNAGELRWLLFWPPALYWPDSRQAADAPMRACLEQLDRWGVTSQLADGGLPLPVSMGAGTLATRPVDIRQPRLRARQSC